MPSSAGDRELVRRIRARDEAAWRECIAEYAGRLQAFATSRLGDAVLAEDLVQETFVGFLTALPNYDETTPLESFLFAIARHKIIDQRRRQGRRPLIPLAGADENHSSTEPASRLRRASSLARSHERRDQEAEVIRACLQTWIQHWFNHGEFVRLKCAELLFVQGLSNQETANFLNLSEQDVANHKQFVLSKLKAAAPS